MRVDHYLPLSALSLSLGKVGPLLETPLLFRQPAGYARATKNDTPDVSRHNIVWSRRCRTRRSSCLIADSIQTTSGTSCLITSLSAKVLGCRLIAKVPAARLWPHVSSTTM